MKTIGINFEGAIAVPKKDKDKLNVANWVIRDGPVSSVLGRLQNDARYCPIVMTFHDWKVVFEWIIKFTGIKAEPYVEGMIRSNATLYLSTKPYPCDFIVAARGEMILIPQVGWNMLFDNLLPATND